MNSSKKSSNTYKCSGCSGDMVFDAKSQGLKCFYCGSVDEIKIEGPKFFSKHNFIEAQKYEEGNESEEIKVIHCESCGGETILEGNNIQVACSFCGNTHTVEKSEIKGVPAESIIPFKITKEEAATRYKKWIGRKIFAPRKLKKNAKAENITSIYIPFWAIDCDTATDFSGDRGVHKYETVKVDGKSVRKRVGTTYTRVTGNFDRQYRDLFQPGSARDNLKHMKSVEPFDFTGRKMYDDRFLSGILSEKYSINLDKAYKTAQKDIDSELNRTARNKIGGDTQRNVRVHTNYRNEKYHHFLAPILISSYMGTNGKSYSFVVNGQTGKISGDVQLSIIRVMLAVLLIAALVAGAYYLGLFDQSTY